MASIELVNASVEIPIYNSRGRSLKTTLIRRVGGQVETDGRDVVTVKALRHVTLSLRPGDRIALVGHNGAGKSTLLRVLARSYEPSAGTAEIEGTVSSLIDMEMGMDPELTGADNIILRGVFVGMSLKEAREKYPADRRVFRTRTLSASADADLFERHADASRLCDVDDAPSGYSVVRRDDQLRRRCLRGPVPRSAWMRCWTMPRSSPSRRMMSNR